MRDFTSEEKKVLELLSLDSLYFEGWDILNRVPAGTVVNHTALYWEAKRLQESGYDLEGAVASYLQSVGTNCT